MKRLSRAALAVLLGTGSAHAATPDETACSAAIAGVQRHATTPPGLLGAIALAESGRMVGARVVAWPWTIDVGGTGQFFDTKADAIAAVAALQAAGTQSIDVGCMQVNLMHHPHAFATLDEAFEPASNVAYAQRFLSDLYRTTQDWPGAIAAYHSSTPEIGAPYQLRVAALWPQGAQYGIQSGEPYRAGMPARPAASDIDPYRVYTPEFRRALMADAATRALRNAHLRAPGPALASALGRKHAPRVAAADARPRR